MFLVVNKSKDLSGTVTPPGSKSQTIRGIFFGLLANGKSTLLNILDSEDTQAAMAVGSALGASIDSSEQGLTIKSSGLPFTITTPEINTGNSGITTRFILPLLGLRKNHTHPILLSCGEQMQARPIKSLVNALRDLGMSIQYVDQENRLPVLVTGRLIGGITEVDGMTSQYLSALLISLPCAEQDSVITVKNLHERPYVDMTLAWLRQQGIAYKHERTADIDTFYIPANQRYKPVHAAIKGDFSSASCLFAAAVLLPGEVELQGLDLEDTQGDKQLITVLQKMGADIIIDQGIIRIKGNKPLKGTAIDANDIPDLVPALAVIATQAAGKTEIYNVEQARIKETDRIHSMTDGLRQMGANIEENPDGMTIYQSKLHGAFVKGYGDHRTVMALSIAGMLADEATVITDAEAINKTYPGFVSAMQSIGASITAQEHNLTKHIILIGFKHVGKSLIGRHLGKILSQNFVDLDKEIEKLYAKRYAKFLTCRQILQTHSESSFRELENAALKQTLELTSCVISLGGGTLLNEANQEMVKPHLLLHVTAPRGVVFERIMVEGRPAFFDPNEDPYESFSRLWNERCKIYENLTTCRVNNSESIGQAVNEAMAHLRQQQLGLIPAETTE